MSLRLPLGRPFPHFGAGYDGRMGRARAWRLYLGPWGYAPWLLWAARGGRRARVSRRRG